MNLKAALLFLCLLVPAAANAGQLPAGMPGQSCSAACAAFGGCDAATTRILGSESILPADACKNAGQQLFGVNAEMVNPRGIVGGGIGCFAFQMGQLIYVMRNVISTTCNAAAPHARRICVCRHNSAQ